MRLSRPILRILLANLAPPFIGSLVLLHIAGLKQRGVLALSEAGLALSTAACAAFIGPLLVGLAVRRLGNRSTGWLSLLMFLLGLGGLATTLRLPLMLAAVFSLGLACAAVVVMGSAELAARVPERTHALIAVQYGATALGGVAAGPFFTWMVRLHATEGTAAPLWLVTFGVPLVLATLLPSLLVGDYSDRHLASGVGFRLRFSLVWVLMLLAGLHGACDVGSYNWMPVWLQDRAHAPESLIATFISVAWLASLAGRGLTIFLSSRFGSAIALRCSSTGAALCMLVTFLSHSPWSLIGAYSAYLVFSAGNLPGLLATANARHPQWRSELTGLTLTTLNAAGAVATYAIGRLAHVSANPWTGIPVSLCAVAAFSALVWLGCADPRAGGGASRLSGS